MKPVIAIDPGTNESAIVWWDGSQIMRKDIVENWSILNFQGWPLTAELHVEMVACYGMAVGKEVFETVLWIGRFIQDWSRLSGSEAHLVYRRDVKLHHCQNSRAKDGNVRQALIDKYGKPGTKKEPGITYGLRSHLWQAFAIATYVTETQRAQ